MMEWLEKETIKISGIKNGSLILTIDILNFEAIYTTNLKKLINDALKLEAYEKTCNTVIIDGEDEILYLTFRRHAQELIVLWEERNLEDKSKDVVCVMRFPFVQFKTDFMNTFKENKEEYLLHFESYRDL